jgi:uncharacterized ParB-like nuclease family protein
VKARRESVQLTRLLRDSRVQSRESINVARVEEYAQSMAKIPVIREAGLEAEDFPPITVFAERKDGVVLYWLADGWHRVMAADTIGIASLEADVYDGDVYDAIMYASGANARHGLARTSRDKHRAVRMLLDHPTVIREQWSNVRISVQAGVSESLVRVVRREREDDLGLPRSTERRGLDGKLYGLQQRTGAGAQATNDATNAPSTPLMHQCSNDGCDAVTDAPSWHCDDCKTHWPTGLHPVGGECPSCVGDERAAASRSSVLATVTSVEIPKANGANGHVSQALYTPGIMLAPATTKAYERLEHALSLIDSLNGYSAVDIVAESSDPERFMARIRGARTTLNALIEQVDGVTA